MAGESGKVIDFISGQLVPATPEETEAIQPMSRQLVEDFGYPVEHITTRPQHRIKQRPSDDQRGYPVDIAVFKTEAKKSDELYIVVEGKRNGVAPDEKPDAQLVNYLSLSSAELGVWTNGEERRFYRKVVENGQVVVREIPTLPRFGESVEAIGKYERRNLRPPANLSTTFRAIRNHLAGNTVGTTRDETLATQLIHLVFCKIFDERFTANDQLVTFRREQDDSFATVEARIHGLFNSVKAKYSDVFDASDEITLTGHSLAYVVGELQPYSLTEAPRDAVGEAFEVFVSTTLKGGQGQFFTPRNVVALMVALIAPKPNELVIDPACGPAGFLVQTLRAKWNQLEVDANRLNWSASALQEERMNTAIKTIYGIEKDGFLAKVAKAYMAIMGDGKGGIHCEDSLNPPTQWAGSTQQDVSLGRFDVVLANPPFGKDIKVTGDAKLAQFNLGHRYQRGVKTSSVLESQNPQILFIERCIQLAKDGGRIGIILPETYLHGPSVKHVTEFITQHNLLALIDLPHNTFRPFNNAKCVAIIFQKNRPQGDSITMVAGEEMGHNQQGKPIFRYDASSNEITEIPWDDISEAISELDRPADKRTFVFEVPSDRVREEGVLVPRYFWPKLNEDALRNNDDAVDTVTMDELIEEGSLTVSPGHGSPKGQFKGRGRVPYIRVKDIISWEIYRDPTAMIPVAVADRLRSTRRLVEGDVVYVSRGSYRIGDVALVGPDDTDVVLTREIHVFRVTPGNRRGLTPFLLLYMLSTEAVRRQTKARVFMDTTLPNISDRYRSIRLPWPDEMRRIELSETVETALRHKWSSMREIRGLLSSLGREEEIEDDDSVMEEDLLDMAAEESDED